MLPLAMRLVPSAAKDSLVGRYTNLCQTPAPPSDRLCGSGRQTRHQESGLTLRRGDGDRLGRRQSLEGELLLARDLDAVDLDGVLDLEVTLEKLIASVVVRLGFDMPLLELCAFRYGIPIADWLAEDSRNFDQPRYRYNIAAHFDLYEWLTNSGASRFAGGLSLAANLIGQPGPRPLPGRLGRLAEPVLTGVGRDHSLIASLTSCTKWWARDEPISSCTFFSAAFLSAYSKRASRFMPELNTPQ